MERAKGYSVFLPNREFLKMQIVYFFSIDEQILRCHLTSTWMVIMKNQIRTRVGQDVEKLEPSNIAVRNEK